ncbi:Na/Pi symporter [Thioclava sp. A2]|uniref:Na/Pi cotransporter family protein n=1 Tax=Thioclava sp. FCG-A2 TaxID=3080562 RepID=UPI002954BD49|nr:Na/Pi symporter [Thioclava sp. A2]MDV7271624.1 Na/Pi symporter [Thioclava sp. A2]
MRRFFLPVALGALIFAFWLNPSVQDIAAGVAIFLFGMLMLEDGFRLLSGGLLERILQASTRSTPRAVLFGTVSTALLQSSSLVSVITISFLSTGLISLIGGVGVIFGANIGTTTGAWLVAGLGLKVNIAAFAMPMIALSIVLVFQKAKPLRGIGYALAGMGFLFLGIHYMKVGFDSFNDEIDLARFAMEGVAGLVVFSLIGAVATVIMQSSHATMTLIITALAAGQITYDNALALAIGANIGTTITAIIGALSANFQGKRLALAHFIFNTLTAFVALVLIVPLRELVDWISAALGIGAADYALKLAVFHSVFNLLGLALMLPALTPLIEFLTRRFPRPRLDISEPHFLSDAVDAFPETLEAALRKELVHLYENAAGILLKGLNLNQQQVYDSEDIPALVRASREAVEIDMDAAYEQRIKTLYAAIVDYATHIGSDDQHPERIERIHALRDVASDIVQAVKSVKHLRKNILHHTTAERGAVTGIYDDLRAEIARIVAEIRLLGQTPPEQRSALWLDQERATVEDRARHTTQKVDALIRARHLSAADATSFLNDSGYAFAAMRDLIEAARSFYIERDPAIAAVEHLVSLDLEEMHETLKGDAPP